MMKLDPEQAEGISVLGHFQSWSTCVMYICLAWLAFPTLMAIWTYVAKSGPGRNSAVSTRLTFGYLDDSLNQN
eukprot:gene835-152_t